LASTLDFNFSKTFEGTIWSMLVVAERNLLILEIRNENRHEVRFFAFNYDKREFLWQDILFNETWWIGLTAATADILLLHTYKNLQNPDGKSLMAIDINEPKVLWEVDQFSFLSLNNDSVSGQFTKDELVPATVDLYTGQVMENIGSLNTTAENITLVKPFQYKENNPYFETVKSFLARKLDIVALAGVEYVEYNSLIFISYHVQEENLVNYLIVFNAAGEEVLREKLAQGLKGIGLETFFILEGCLFFVRNKCELVSFRIV
jgi:hypothetical protein